MHADDAEELYDAVVVPVVFEAQIDSERADGFAPDHDRHADEGQFLLEPLSLGGAVQQHRLPAYLRDDYGFPLSTTRPVIPSPRRIMGALPLGRNPVGSFNVQL